MITKEINYLKEYQKKVMMRKLLLSIFMLCILSVAANAQVYMGGTFGFTYRKDVNDVSKRDFTLVPEIGYQLNDKISTGLNLGYRHIETPQLVGLPMLAINTFLLELPHISDTTYTKIIKSEFLLMVLPVYGM